MRGDPVVLDRDEGIRPETTEQTLATLRPIMPGGTVTAGNSAQQNDAAAHVWWWPRTSSTGSG